MDTLSVVNRCFAKMGEAPLPDLNEDHELLPAAMAAIKDKSLRTQVRGWWFNTDYFRVEPDSNNEIVFPPDTINVRVDDDAAPGRYVAQGGKLYDRVKRTNEITRRIKMRVIREVPFDELPIEAAAYIGDLAVAEFQTDYDGDNTKTLRLLNSIEGPHGSRAMLNAEEIRQKRVNLFHLSPRLMRTTIAYQSVRWGT